MAKSKIIYEYLGERFTESKTGLTYINDNGDAVKGYYEKVWYEGSDVIEDNEIKEFIRLRKATGKYRNFRTEPV